MSARRLLLGVLVALALALPAQAAAGPFLGRASRTRAHPGDIVHIQAGAGVRIYALLPLYLVPAARAPRPHPCHLRNGTAAGCEAWAPHAPHGGVYHRIGTVNVRHRNLEMITYTVPRLPPGRYVYVMYCGPCYRGSGGSLIPFTDSDREPALTVLTHGGATSSPPRQLLVLSRHGIAGVRFGLAEADAVRRLSRLLGPASRRFANSGCGPRYSEVAWGHLYAEFRLGTFSGVRYMTSGWLPKRLAAPKPAAVRKAPLRKLTSPILATSTGISLGSTLAQLRAAYRRLDRIGTDRWQSPDGLIFYDNARRDPPPASSRIVEIKFGTCGDF